MRYTRLLRRRTDTDAHLLEFRAGSGVEAAKGGGRVEFSAHTPIHTRTHTRIAVKSARTRAPGKKENEEKRISKGSQYGVKARRHARTPHAPGCGTQLGWAQRRGKNKGETDTHGTDSAQVRRREGGDMHAKGGTPPWRRTTQEEAARHTTNQQQE